MLWLWEFLMWIPYDFPNTYDRRTHGLSPFSPHFRSTRSSRAQKPAQQARSVHCEALVLHTAPMNLFSWRSAPRQHNGRRRQRRDAHVWVGWGGGTRRNSVQPSCKIYARNSHFYCLLTAYSQGHVNRYGDNDSLSRQIWTKSTNIMVQSSSETSS